MCPEPPFPPARQQGFALATAIFLLVVLAALGAAMLTFSSAQHVGSAMDVQGARALQAARAGIEWGAYQALRGTGCGGTTLALDGFSVTVTATPTASGALTACQLTSTASVGGIGFVCVAPAVGQAKVLPAFARAVLTLLHALSAAPPAANGLDRARLADELAALLHGHGGSATRLSDAALVKLFRLLRLARRLLDLEAGVASQDS